MKNNTLNFESIGYLEELKIRHITETFERIKEES